MIGGAVQRAPAPWPYAARPKVVHVVVAGEIGGAERMLVDLASHPELSGADHVVALMTPNPRLSRLFRSAGIALRDRGPVRENPAAFLWRSLGPSDAAWLEGVLRAERADRVVAISHHIRAVVLARDPRVSGRLSLVPNGVDTVRFACRPCDPAEEAGEPFSFVLVGRLERRKGVDIAIEALARVPGARLDVVGDGCERLSLERRAAALGVAGRVRFHGHVDDTRDVLARGQVALCSSREEGLGIALLEAMAMERPVVAFPVGGVPELVVEGRTGWLAKARTSEALAARMRDAMADPALRPTLGRAARATVIDRYSVRAMCEGYGVVYAALARTRPLDPRSAIGAGTAS